MTVDSVIFMLNREKWGNRRKTHSLSSIQAFSLCIKIQEKTLLHVYQCIVPSTDFYYCYKLFFQFLFNLSLFYRLLGVRNSIIMATLLSRRRERYIIVRMQVCLAVDHNEQYSRPLLERKKAFLSSPGVKWVYTTVSLLHLFFHETGRELMLWWDGHLILLVITYRHHH